MGDFEAEIESINSAASWMDGNAVATAKKLQETLTYLNSFAASTDWSAVPSCLGFGSSYNAAIAAYKSLADDLLKDAETMRDALKQIAHHYTETDANSADQLSAVVAGLADQHWFTTNDGAQATYEQNKPDLHSDKPEQAPDVDADTGGPNGNGSTAPGSSGSGANGNAPGSGAPATTGGPSTGQR